MLLDLCLSTLQVPLPFLLSGYDILLKHQSIKKHKTLANFYQSNNNLHLNVTYF